MSTTTTNLGLFKPELTDPADITQMNQNWDKIDKAIEDCAADIPVTSEVPENTDIWIDPDDVSAEEAHLTNMNNPHNVTAEQIGAATLKAVHRNLLDNSDFTNPVNQRGQTNYSGDGYTIDRWYMSVYSGKLTISDGYIRLEDETNDLNHIRQKINRKFTKPTPVTFAVRAKGSGFGITYYGNFANITSCNDWTTLVYNYVIPAGTDLAVSLDYNPLITWQKGTTVDVQWAALYEGEYTLDTLPEYHSKGYAVELAECQRYYRHYLVDFNAFAGALVGGVGYITINLTDNPMRVAPSLVGSGTFYVTSSIYTGRASDDLSLHNTSKNGVTIKMTVPAEGTSVGIFSKVDSYFALSADL